MGVHDLATDTVNLQQGHARDRGAAGKGSNFTSLTGAALTSFNAAYPNRIAVKHAHSQQNSGKDWGTDTLNAVRFAIYALNEENGDKNPDGTTRRPYTADNTIVIASSVSNGGGAALAAAEQDTDNLIDGVAVAEPSVAPGANDAAARDAQRDDAGRHRDARSTTTSRWRTCCSRVPRFPRARPAAPARHSSRRQSRPIAARR